MSRSLLVALCLGITSTVALGAGGTLTVKTVEKGTDQPVITRFELWRGPIDSKHVPVRRTVSAGMGIVLDESIDLTLPESLYTFRMIRGPEYRIVTGNFALDKTSLDQKTVPLTRMVEMRKLGWISGDCCVVPSPHRLEMRMAGEDLHLARTLGKVAAKPVAKRKADEMPDLDPTWISHDVTHREGLVFYGDASFEKSVDDPGDDKLPSSRFIVAATKAEEPPKIAIENPFAWELPVWIASQKIDGYFLLGDWLRLDKKIARVVDGRPLQGINIGGAKSVGRHAERIYWNLLESGHRIPPLAGGGDQSGNNPIGYNRLYTAEPLHMSSSADPEQTVGRPASKGAWWGAAFRGCSVATNGPLLRPRVDGELPGFVFKSTGDRTLNLEITLDLAVRDPVEYMEVIHNGRVHYSAKLDEFAKAGGYIPPVIADESGWITIRVVTLYEDHFRAAMSAPWYIEFDGQRRVTERSVEFFHKWLDDYEQRLLKLPKDKLQKHVPFVRAARKYWLDKENSPGFVAK